LGLDTISVGGTIGFAMECAERGLLDAPMLRFGHGEGMLRMLEQIARREGLGARLAEGTKRLAEQIGGDAPHFAAHVKGLEIPGYEPRALQTMALGFAVGARGADHNRSGAYEVDFSPQTDRFHAALTAVPLAIDTEDRAALLDSLILCKFLRGVFSDLFGECAELLTHITGWDVTAEELRETVKRIVNLKKLFNIREGWTAVEDTLPARFLTESLPTGVAKGAALSGESLAAMVQAYYRERGWAPDGLIPAPLANSLGLTSS
jgi:aldehyde:ferredoxin oxidoreductase